MIHDSELAKNVAKLQSIREQSAAKLRETASNYTHFLYQHALTIFDYLPLPTSSSDRPPRQKKRKLPPTTEHTPVQPRTRKTRRVKMLAPTGRENAATDIGVTIGKENVGRDMQKKRKGVRGNRRPLMPIARNDQIASKEVVQSDIGLVNDVRKCGRKGLAKEARQDAVSKGAVASRGKRVVISKESKGDAQAVSDDLEECMHETDMIEGRNARTDATKTQTLQDVDAYLERPNEVPALVEQHDKFDELLQQQTYDDEFARQARGEQMLDHGGETPTEGQYDRSSTLKTNESPKQIDVKGLECPHEGSGKEARMDQGPVMENDRTLPQSSSHDGDLVAQKVKFSVQSMDVPEPLRSEKGAEESNRHRSSEKAALSKPAVAREPEFDDVTVPSRESNTLEALDIVSKEMLSDKSGGSSDTDSREKSNEAFKAEDKAKGASEESSDEETPVIKRSRRNRVLHKHTKVGEKERNISDQKVQQGDDNPDFRIAHDGLNLGNDKEIDDGLVSQPQKEDKKTFRADKHDSNDSRGGSVGEIIDEPCKCSKSGENALSTTEENNSKQVEVTILAEQSVKSHPDEILPADNSSQETLSHEDGSHNQALTDSKNPCRTYSPKIKQDALSRDPVPDSLYTNSASQEELGKEESGSGHIVHKDKGKARAEESIPKVAYKLPKPRQEHSQTTANCSSGDLKGSVSFSFQILQQNPSGEGKEQPGQHLRSERSNARPQLVVGKDGMIGEASIGFLSELASTPATSSRAKISTDTAQADAGLQRRTRLFNPTPSIYSATKRALRRSSLRSVGSSASALPMLDARIASQRLTKDLFSHSARNTDREALSSGEILAKIHASSGRNPQTSIEKESDFVANQNAGCKIQNMSIEPKQTNLHDGDGSTNIRELQPLTQHMGADKNELLQSPSHNVLQTKSLFASNHLYACHRITQPKTAPGKTVRLRTEGNLVKSAFRERIERLHANASASRPLPGASAVLASSNINIRGSSGVNSSCTPADNTLGQQSDDTQASPLEDGNGLKRPREENYPTNGLSNIMKMREDGSLVIPASASLGSLDGKDAVLPDAKNADNTRLSRLCEHDNSPSTTAKMTKGVTKTPTPSQIEGVTPKRFANEVSLESSEELRTTKEKDKVGESVTPTSDYDTQSDGDGNADIEMQRSSQKNSEKPVICPEVISLQKLTSTNTETPGAISNLVSSVASFLPSASSLFGSHLTNNSEKSEEEQAELLLKRQYEIAERREAELFAKREAQRIARQREAEEKQKKAEIRRRLLAEAEKHREEEKRRKEELRRKKKQDEEEKQRAKKEEEDRKREEHRRRVLEQKRQNEKAVQRKEKNLPGKLKAFHPNATMGRPGPTNATRTGKIISTGALPPQLPKTPRLQKQLREDSPQWELTEERKRGVSESSDEVRARRRRKVVPQWASSTELWRALQDERDDPDVVFARGAPSCNLESVFQSQTAVRRFRPREDSGDWTKDRLTAKEEMEYKRRAGFFDNV